MILLDTSILIDYYRKEKKEKTLFQNLAKHYTVLYISQVTYFEILRGSNVNQEFFWIDLFKDLTYLDFDNKCADEAVLIYKDLKLKNKLIETADLFIAATALAHHLPIATLNIKDFEKVPNLEIISI